LFHSSPRELNKRSFNYYSHFSTRPLMLKYQKRN